MQWWLHRVAANFRLDRRSNNRIKGDCYPYNNHFAPKKATFKFDPYMGNGFNAFDLEDLTQFITDPDSV